jgi:hypothetical protein
MLQVIKLRVRKRCQHVTISLTSNIWQCYILSGCDLWASRYEVAVCRLTKGGGGGGIYERWHLATGKSRTHDTGSKRYRSRNRGHQMETLHVSKVMTQYMLSELWEWVLVKTADNGMKMLTSNISTLHRLNRGWITYNAQRQAVSRAIRLDNLLVYSTKYWTLNDSISFLT